jgi:phosphopantetheine adenylyltransferase
MSPFYNNLVISHQLFGWRKADVTVAKNYLNREEIESLNLIVSAYLDFAELQARSHRPMHMRDWIAKLDDFFGPGIAAPDVQAIVVSRETVKRVSTANALRKEKGYPPLETVVVDFVLADDSKPISSTRVRKGEIDTEGRLRPPRDS